jgi:hypothetical protein
MEVTVPTAVAVRVVVDEGFAGVNILDKLL